MTKRSSDDVTRRAILTQFALGGTATMGNLALAGTPDVGFVHKELRPFAQKMLSSGGTFPDPTRDSLAAVRAAMAAEAPRPLAHPAFARRLITGAAGAPELPVYVINAQSGAAKPAIIHLHGGGFIAGSASTMIATLQATAAALDCVIVSVDYRLAPETTFAGSIEDNYAALEWLNANAAEIGVDRTRIAVMGESAGGGHAALLAITARDRGAMPLVLQVLLYPMLDDRTGSVIRISPPAGSLLWTASKNRFGWEAFLGQAPGQRTVPKRAAPARQASLKGLAPAFIGVGSIDLLVDESIDYARRLIDSHVPAELVVVPGAFHAFDRIAATTLVAQRFTAAKLAALRQAFARPILRF